MRSAAECFLSFQVLIKPKPVFQTAVVSEQTRQLVTETLQQVTRAAEVSQAQTSGHDGSGKEDTGSLGEAPSLSSNASQSSAQGTVYSLTLQTSPTQALIFKPIVLWGFPKR